MHKPVKETSLREVHLLAMLRAESQVERANEVQCRSLHIEAVTDDRGQSRVNAYALGSNCLGSTIEVHSMGQVRLRTIPMRQRQDRSIVGEHAHGRHKRAVICGS